ncbi:hypothetical protein C8Q78DRAFT_1068425 [Trametes maxima]|nr:hypothetical protein C8Q78DRAFT_1068425 [Trametes maxima]
MAGYSWSTLTSRRLGRICNLPPEVWLRVFAYATYIPGALEHDDGQAMAAFSRDKYGIIVHRRHREATDLMLDASRVCKTWTPLVTEFLFRYILVRSGDHAVEVAAALERYGYNLAGRWTIRLELALEGVHRWDDEHAAALARIFTFCPNVTVFSTAFSTTDASLFQDRRFLRAMRDVSMRSNLKRLELRGDATLLGTVLPPLATNLESLWLLPSRRTAPNHVFDPMHFPLVHTFVLSEGFGWGGPPSNWTMPALNTLCTEDDNLTAHAQMKLWGFFETHGPQLERLVTCRSTFECLNHCTNLVEWTLPCGVLFDASRFTPMGRLPPTIRRLTLVDDVSTTYMLRLDHITLLVDWLGADLLPALESIGFLLPLGRHVRRQRPRDDWEQVIGSLHNHSRRRGVRLEASVGGDEHTAQVWTSLSLDHLVEPLAHTPSKSPFSGY